LARRIGNPDIEAVLEAAAKWRGSCFEDDGSVLGNERLWTAGNLEALRDLFRANPILGADRSFSDKLREQLAGASTSLSHLAAEVIWFLLLFPHHSKYGVEKKIERIKEVWEFASSGVPPNIDNAALMGVGKPGTAYITRFPDEFGFLIDAMAAWKQRPNAERSTLLANEDAPWRFADWLASVPGSERRPARHALLFFLFPDSFESIVSGEHKRQIIATFRNEIPIADRPRGARPALLERDKALFALRQVLEASNPGVDVNFYRPPFSQRWQSGVRDEARSLIASELTRVLGEHGLEIHLCGSKKRSLADCGEVSDTTGFWSRPADATNKPLRWIIHIELGEDGLVASLAGQHGDRRIAFANTKGGISGMVLTRVLPAIKLDGGAFTFHETWEWMLVFGFLPALPPGSSGQLVGDFDPATGRLDYMGSSQPYVSAALIALSESDDVFEHPQLGRSISYAEATAAVQAFLQVEPAFNFPEVADAAT
jgi:hypothetical protein